MGAGPGGLGGPRPARAPAALKTGAVLAPAQAPVRGRSARAPAVASAARPDAGRRGVRVRKAAPAPGQTAQGQKTSLRCRHREGNDERNSQGKMESHVRGQNRERNQSRHRPGSLAVTLHARPPPGPGCPRVGAAAPRPVPRACFAVQLWTGSSQPSSQDCPPEPHASRGSRAATTRRRLLRPCPARRRAGEQAHAVTRTSNGGAECHRRHRGGAS